MPEIPRALHTLELEVRAPPRVVAEGRSETTLACLRRTDCTKLRFKGNAARPRDGALVYEMRWLLGTLLASSHHVRHHSPLLSQQPLQLAEEEYKALAGVWRADLELEEHGIATSLHLAAPNAISFDADGLSAYAQTQGGRVFPMDDKLPNADRMSSAWWSVTRTTSTGTEGDAGDAGLRLSMQLGNLYLEGKGQRNGNFRCSAFSGTVLEGGDAPCVVGQFLLRLSLPMTSNITSLEGRYRQRIATQPAPPLEYLRTNFVGRWRLLLSMDDDYSYADASQPSSGASSSSLTITTGTGAGHDEPIVATAHERARQVLHTFFAIELSNTGSWQSVGGKHTLAGSWGMGSSRGSTDGSGSRVWLSVESSKCSETLRGVAGLPVRSDFQMAGKPVHDTRDQAEEIVEDGKSFVRADRVDGRLWEGSVEPAYFGSFTLLREMEISSEVGLEISELASGMESLIDACDEGFETACDTLSKEDEAKRQWLEEVELTEACDEGHETACKTLSSEKEAKRAWLAKYDATELLQNPKVGDMGALGFMIDSTYGEPWAEATGRGGGESSGGSDDSSVREVELSMELLEAALQAEQEARRAAEYAANAAREAERAALAEVDWLHERVLSLEDEAALTDACESGHDEACVELSMALAEQEAKRAWLARLDVPTWGPKQEAVLQEACVSGDDTACDTLSREEEAKRAWLARLDVPTWGPKREI